MVDREAGWGGAGLWFVGTVWAAVCKPVPSCPELPRPAALTLPPNNNPAAVVEAGGVGV